MIMFRNLKWKNFLSTGNIFTEIQLDKHNSTLIIGENGAGKSTILDVLSYALFGKPFRKINKSQLVNSITRKGLEVEIEFDISPNKYKIVRGMKPNVFEVYQNGNLLNQSADMKDYQELLEKQILKINQKSFCQVVILGSATFQPFMQLQTSHRREIIEDILDLQIFTVMNNLLKDKISLNNEHIADVQTNQKVFQEKIKLIKEHLVEVQNSSVQIATEKAKLIDETKDQIKDAEKKVKHLDKGMKDLVSKIEDKDKIDERIDKLKKIRMQIEHKLENLNDEIKFFEDHEHCPVCLQDIQDDFKSKTITEKKNQVDEIKNGAPKLLEEYQDARKKLEKILEAQSQATDKKMEIHRLKTKISSWIEYIETLQKEIDNIIKKVETDDTSKIEELQLSLKETEKNYNTLIDEKNLYIVASSLLKDGGIKSKIIKQYIPIINKLINKYLSAMDFFVQFELDEEFNETIKSRFRDEFSYASFSEGEKMRINLAILFTWRAVAKLRNSISTNLLIMDEVFDSSLDSNGTDEFMKIINELTCDNNTFIISHKGDQLIDKFTNVIKFEKHKNFSKVA